MLKEKAEQLQKETEPLVDDDAKPKEKAWERPDPKKIPDILRPNPVDYMAYALVDDSLWRYSKDKYGILRSVLSKYLLPGLGNYKDYIQWLRAYEVLPYKFEQNLSSKIPDEGIKSAILQCKNIHELGRITASITDTANGSNFLSSNGKWLVYVIEKLFEGAKGKVLGLKLKYINALFQKLEMMGIVPDEHISAAGLLYASQVSNCEAMYKYLKFALANKDGGKTQPEESIMTFHRQALVSAVSRVYGSLPPLTKASVGWDPIMWRRQLLRVLSSWEFGVPIEEEERKPCFALLVHNIDMYVDYINALAKLRADYAILYEFNHPELTPILGISNEEAKPLKGVEIFVNAFIGVDDPLQALKILNKHAQRNGDQHSGEGDSPKRNKITSKRMLLGSGLDGKQWATLRKALATKYMGKQNQPTYLHRDLWKLNDFSINNMKDLKKILWSPFKNNEPVEWTDDIDNLMISKIRTLERDNQRTEG